MIQIVDICLLLTRTTDNKRDAIAGYVRFLITSRELSVVIGNNE